MKSVFAVTSWWRTLFRTKAHTAISDISDQAEQSSVVLVANAPLMADMAETVQRWTAPAFEPPFFAYTRSGDMLAFTMQAADGAPTRSGLVRFADANGVPLVGAAGLAWFRRALLQTADPKTVIVESGPFDPEGEPGEWAGIVVLMPTDTLDQVSTLLGPALIKSTSPQKVSPTMRLSQLALLHGLASGSDVREIEAALGESKAIMSEYGWAFLTNDTNAFLRVQFGECCWTDAVRARAASVFTARKAYFGDKGVRYGKFIIPEKSVVYREYLPRALAGLTEQALRPAMMLQADEPEIVHYLADFLSDAKSYGLTYFRGDSHTNWLGGWLVYMAIATWMQDSGVIGADQVIPLSKLLPTIAGYDGDLLDHLSAEGRSEYMQRWGILNGRFGFEQTIKLDLEPDASSARRVETPAEYEAWFTGRETFVYERVDKSGPRAVIFRDSTLDRSHELLAQHFSRSVFIWHGGLIYEEVLERENPDVVIQVMAERFTVRYDVFPPVATLKDFP